MRKKKRFKKMYKKNDDAIQESSNEFTPFRRAVCDWLLKEKLESKDFSDWLGQGGAVRPRTTQYPKELFWINQQFLLCWQSGGFLGSVVLHSAADSLLHWGEVLCLAELPGHTRHIGSTKVNTETLQRGKKHTQKRSNKAGDPKIVIQVNVRMSTFQIC